MVSDWKKSILIISVPPLRFDFSHVINSAKFSHYILDKLEFRLDPLLGNYSRSSMELCPMEHCWTMLRWMRTWSHFSPTQSQERSCHATCLSIWSKRWSARSRRVPIGHCTTRDSWSPEGKTLPSEWKHILHVLVIDYLSLRPSAIMLGVITRLGASTSNRLWRRFTDWLKIAMVFKAS